MGWRFRRSIKIAPGIRWNISSRGSSWSFGRRGYTVNVSSRGVRRTVSIPGTGLSHSSFTAELAAHPRHRQVAITRRKRLTLLVPTPPKPPSAEPPSAPRSRRPVHDHAAGRRGGDHRDEAVGRREWHRCWAGSSSVASRISTTRR